MARITIDQWIAGKVDYPLSDATINSIFAEHGLVSGMPYDGVSRKSLELSLADVYLFLSRTSVVSSGETESDNGWSHKEATRNIPASVRAYFVKEASRLYAKWGESLESESPSSITLKPLY